MSQKYSAEHFQMFENSGIALLLHTREKIAEPRLQVPWDLQQFCNLRQSPHKQHPCHPQRQMPSPETRFLRPGAPA